MKDDKGKLETVIVLLYMQLAALGAIVGLMLVLIERTR